MPGAQFLGLSLTQMLHLGRGLLYQSARIQVIATFLAVLCLEGTLVAAETPLPLLGEAHLVFQPREHVRSSGHPTQPSTPPPDAYLIMEYAYSTSALHYLHYLFVVILFQVFHGSSIAAF